MRHRDLMDGVVMAQNNKAKSLILQAVCTTHSN